MEIFIKIPFSRPTEKTRLWKVVKGDLKESASFLRRDKPVLIRVIILLALFNLVLSSAMVIGIPVVIVNVLSMSDFHLGLAQAALGLGGLIGGILGGVLADKLKLHSTYVLLIVCALTAAVMGLALMPFVPRLAAYIIICIMSVATMTAATWFTVQLCAAIQRQTPAHLIGKIMAVVLMISNCASPLGQALYGVLFDALALTPYIIMFGASATAIIIALFSKKTFLRLEQEEYSHETELSEKI